MISLSTDELYHRRELLQRVIHRKEYKSADYISGFSRNSFTIRRIQRHIGSHACLQFYWLKYLLQQLFQHIEHEELPWVGIKPTWPLPRSMILQASTIATSTHLRVFHETIASHLVTWLKCRSIYFTEPLLIALRRSFSLVRHTTSSNDTNESLRYPFQTEAPVQT